MQLRCIVWGGGHERIVFEFCVILKLLQVGTDKPMPGALVMRNPVECLAGMTGITGFVIRIFIVFLVSRNC